MKRKAQVLIIFLWILTSLVVLVIGIASRASATFKLIRRQKDAQRVLYIARTGLNKAIYELDKDKSANTYDALSEPWADPAFGVADEERKININFAGAELLEILLEKSGIPEPQNTARNILIWRGDDVSDDAKVYEVSGYAPKLEKFINTEELMVVPGITPEGYLKLKDLVTVYTADKKININTASFEVLSMVASAIARQLQANGALNVATDDLDVFAENVVKEIIAAKDGNGGYFKNINDIVITPTGAEELNIYNALIDNIVFASNNFYIEVEAKAGRIENKIRAVYNRKIKQFSYWYEG